MIPISITFVSNAHCATTLISSWREAALLCANQILLDGGNLPDKWVRESIGNRPLSEFKKLSDGRYLYLNLPNNMLLVRISNMVAILKELGCQTFVYDENGLCSFPLSTSKEAPPSPLDKIRIYAKDRRIPLDAAVTKLLSIAEWAEKYPSL